jgi:hypothetical protein
VRSKVGVEDNILRDSQRNEESGERSQDEGPLQLLQDQAGHSFCILEAEAHLVTQPEGRHRKILQHDIA